MWKFLRTINKNLTYAIPVMMILGFFVGYYYDTAYLKKLIIPFTFLMVYPRMVNLKIKKVFEGGDVKAQLITQLINFGVIPFLAFGLGYLFFKDQPYMALGLLLAGLVPTSGMTISWTGFARGNLEAAVKMTVIGLTLGSIATPFYVQFLMGASLEVNIVAVMKQIVIVVFVPMLAGFVTQQGLIRAYGTQGFQQRWAPRFPSLSTLGVLGIVFIAISIKAKAIAGAPQTILYILLPLLIIYTFNYLLSTIIGKTALPRGDAIALVYGSVMRNLSIALAIALNAFGTEGSSAALVIAVAYIIQVQSAAWYVKFTPRIFGEKEPETPPDKTEKPKEKTTPVPREKPAETCESNLGKVLCPISKILYATDLSETSRNAIRYACTLGCRFNAQVTVLHVIPDAFEEFSRFAGVDFEKYFGKDKWKEFNEQGIVEAKQNVRARIETLHRELMKETSFCPVSPENIRVEVGNPSEIISKIANEENNDLVIMGNGGNGSEDNILAKSIAKRVIDNCQKPVLVVHPASA